MTTIDGRELSRTDLRLTTLGFGGGPIGCRRTAAIDDGADKLLEAAWEGGIRYYDTAPYYGYGDSERRVGRGVARRSRDDFVFSNEVGVHPTPLPRRPRRGAGRLRLFI